MCFCLKKTAVMLRAMRLSQKESDNHERFQWVDIHIKEAEKE